MPFNVVPSSIAGKRSRVPPIGIVRLGITTAVAFVPRYRGNTTATSWPCATSAFGSASTTSARPPVFENGSPSDATNKILMIRSAPASRSFYATGAKSRRQLEHALFSPTRSGEAGLSDIETLEPVRAFAENPPNEFLTNFSGLFSLSSPTLYLSGQPFTPVRARSLCRLRYFWRLAFLDATSCSMSCSIGYTVRTTEIPPADWPHVVRDAEPSPAKR